MGCRVAMIECQRLTLSAGQRSHGNVEFIFETEIQAAQHILSYSTLPLFVPLESP